MTAVVFISVKPTTALEAFERPTLNVGHPFCTPFFSVMLLLISSSSSSLSFIIYHWTSPPSPRSPLACRGRGVNCLGASQSSSWRSHCVAALLSFCFIPPDNSFPQEKASRSAATSHSVHIYESVFCPWIHQFLRKYCFPKVVYLHCCFFTAFFPWPFSSPCLSSFINSKS